jgi:hypothetical protein
MRSLYIEGLAPRGGPELSVRVRCKVVLPGQYVSVAVRSGSGTKSVMVCPLVGSS